MISEDALVSYSDGINSFLKTSCSSQTVQPQREGFFKDYYAAVRSHVDEEMLEKFSELTTDEARLTHIWNIKQVHDLPIKKLRKTKDAKLAEVKRNEGNQLFAKENYQDAKQQYSLSALLAPYPKAGSQESTMSLALGNRAACWLHLRELELCLQDVEESLACGYPNKLHYKALDRKGTALAGLGRHNEAVFAFIKAIEALKQAELNKKQRSRWERDLTERKNMCKEKINSNTSKQSNKEDKKPTLLALGYDGVDPTVPTLSYGASIKFLTASSAVDVCETETEGRFATAAKPIKAGDTLVVESPYVSCLLPERYASYCIHCLTRLKSPYPCFWCVRVAFCSAYCRKRACSTHHRWECPLLDFLFGSGMSITCYMALRLITQHGLQFYTAKKQLLSELQDVNQGILLTGPNQSYDPSNYLSVYTLVTHCKERSAEDFLHRGLMAAFLLRCLKVLGFFERKEPREIPPDFSTATTLSDKESFIGGLLLRHLQLLQFNAHEISECQMISKDLFEGSKTMFIGAGLYPTVSFFNHSCEPGIIRYFVGNQIVVRSIKTLRQGEMIAENYGPTVARLNKEERQKQLTSRYWFKCNCQPCREDWPTYKELQADDIKIRCSSCGRTLGKPEALGVNPIAECGHCGETTNVLKALKTLEQTEATFKKGMQLMKEMKAQEALDCLLNLLDTLHTILVPPHKDITLTEEATWKCMLALGSTYNRYIKT